MPTIKVKICGITNVSDALAAADLGADAIGLNFYADSPRCVSPDCAAQILTNLPPFVEPVGVFVNVPMDQVREIMGRLGLRTFQWHGEPSENDTFQPHEVVPLQAIRAFSVRDVQSLKTIAAHLARWGSLFELPAAILVDAHVPGSYGGTGQVVPWQLLADFTPGVPLILAGGLTPDNVAQAIRTVRPYGVDVASGVESSPGQKDADKMRRFIEQARSVEL